MVKVKAPAKINLCLDILSTLDNGYHSVWMVMQTVGLYDIVSVKKTNSSKIEIFCERKDVPTEEKNMENGGQIFQNNGDKQSRNCDQDRKKYSFERRSCGRKFGRCSGTCCT